MRLLLKLAAHLSISNMKKIALILLIAFVSAKAFSQKSIDIKDAAKHIGDSVTVCSKVFTTRYLDQAGITFLNVGGAYPDNLLTIVIKGEDRKKFKDAPEDAFKDKNICVTGTIIDYKGKPEIAVTDPAQIKISDK